MYQAQSKFDNNPLMHNSDFIAGAQAASFVAKGLFQADGNPIATHVFEYRLRPT